jgi:hypothetical protein
MITLTYGQWWPGLKECKVQLDTLFKRLRRAYPKAGFIWRMEAQKRGAPHFHLLAINVKAMSSRLVAKMWGSITGRRCGGGVAEDLESSWRLRGRGVAVACVDEDGLYWSPICCCENVRSFNGVMWYAAKYCAKVTDCGFRPPEADGGPPLDSVSYFTTGRHWGITARDKLPWGKLIKVPLTSGPGVYDWKLVTRWRRMMRARVGVDCMTLISGCPDDWIEAWLFEGRRDWEFHRGRFFRGLPQLTRPVPF